MTLGLLGMRCNDVFMVVQVSWRCFGGLVEVEVEYCSRWRERGMMYMHERKVEGDRGCGLGTEEVLQQARPTAGTRSIHGG